MKKKFIDEIMSIKKEDLIGYPMCAIGLLYIWIITVAIYSVRLNVLTYLIIFIISMAYIYFLRFLKLQNWLKKNHLKLIVWAKCVVVGLCICIIVLTLKIDYGIALENFLLSILLFTFISFSYFLIVANKKERKKILSIYSRYYAIVVALTLMIYFTYKDAIVFYSDYYKNKISYDLKSTEVDNTFSKYQKFFDKNIVIFEETEVKDKDTGEATGRKTVFFINIASTVMVLVTIFTLIQFMYEINFSRHLKKDKNLTIRKKISSHV